jgi:hypothetical protein
MATASRYNIGPNHLDLVAGIAILVAAMGLNQNSSASQNYI